MILGHICYKCAHEGKVCVTRENPIVSTPSCGNGYGSYEEKVINCHKSPAHQQGNVMLKFVCGNCGCIHYPSMGWKIESGSVWTDWIPEKNVKEPTTKR